MARKFYVIGVGGVGSWAVPALCLLKNPEDIVLIDGDKLEKKNLNRQLFDESDIGSNKAEALAKKYGCSFRAEWFSQGLIAFEPEDWLIVCVDNHPARLAALSSVDEYRPTALIAANERRSSEAYIYQYKWRDTKLDPRIADPSMVTDTSGDPRSGAIGCTGDAQKAEPQLVTANMAAAALALHLLNVHLLDSPIMKRDEQELLPFRFRMNATKLETHKIKDFLCQEW